MAQWQFELWITDTASENYEAWKKLADAAVCSFEGPLPMNSDSRLLPRLSAINRFERTRKMLRSIRNPEHASLDIGISGPAHFVRYRVELGTCIYFARVATTPPAVLVYAVSDAPLDPFVIRKLVLSGNAYLLEKLGLPPIEVAGGYYVN